MAVEAAQDRPGHRYFGVALAFILPSFGLLAYAICGLVRYTPLFRPLECMQLQGGLQPFHVDANLVKTTGAVRSSCHNRNSYVVQIASERAKVFFVEDNGTLIAAGTSFVPETCAAAHGETVIERHIEVTVPSAFSTAVLSRHTLRVVTESQVRLEGALNFFGVRFPFGGHSSGELCGFEVRLATGEVGPSVCAATLEELAIPSLTAAVAPHWMHMSPRHIAAAAWKKDLAFGALAILSSALALWRLRYCWPRAQPAVDKAEVPDLV